MRTSFLLVGVVVGFLSALLPSCGGTTCSPASCPLGCCDALGRCQTATSQTCGVRGSVCTTCQLTESCFGGTCMGSGLGPAGGGTAFGGGSSFGGGNTFGGGTVTGGGTASSGFGAFLDNLASAFCSKAIACGQLAGGSQTDCTLLLRTSLAAGRSIGPVSTASERSVLAGAASFDATRGQECLTRVSSSSCSEFGRFSCAAITRPAATGTSACFSSNDCQDQMLTCNGAACMRRCSLGGNLGEACRRSAPPCNAPFECIDGLCRAEPAVGTPCTGSSDCGRNGYCLNTFCARLPGPGVRCLTNASPQCNASSYCEFSSGLCRAKGALNAVCTSNTQCEETLFCGPGGFCTEKRTLGGACTTSFGGECQGTLRCINRICSNPGPMGSRCSGSFDCADDLGCDTVLRICRSFTPVNSGESCSSTQFCSGAEDVCRNLRTNPDGGVGSFGTCGPPMAGDSCSSGPECGSGRYCDRTTRTCQPAGAGTPCSSERDCRATDYCTSSSVCAGRAMAGLVCDSTRSSSCVTPLECLATAVPNESRCGMRPGQGQPCPGQLCTFGSICLNGTCVAAGRPGQPCLGSTAPLSCFTGECVSPDGGLFFNSSGTCVAPRPSGSLCSGDQGCASGYCFAEGFREGTCVDACR